LKKLKLEDIKGLPNVPTKIYEIEEWGFSVELQGISKAKQIELGRIVDANNTDAFDYQKELLKACIIDPELSDEDIDELYKKDSKIIDNIFLEINTLNGVGGSANADQFQD
jgi:hypothetical protein|tara:strand:- start:4667 stop:4999 length:333 start_codon:yes stop_codon:yes gene_type:complete